jgi:uncharacterized protein involved in type VI secretion and phage assembly
LRVDLEHGTYRNHFRAASGGQTALVARLPDEPLTTDRDRRVKI